MDKIEKIKVEIERRIEECSVQNFIDLEMEYRELLSFIDSLPEELSHSEVTKTCPRYDQEAVSEDFEEEVDAFWHDGISQEKDEVEGVLNKTEFKAYARHFAQWQKEQDRKEFELLKEWFQDIAEKCEHLTSGNVSHNGAAIRGFAKNCVEYIESDVL